MNTSSNELRPRQSWAVIDRPYSLGIATVGALYERPQPVSDAKPRPARSGGWAVLIFFLMTFNAFGQAGADLYKQLCAACHDTGADRAPAREALGVMSAERVLAAMETGPMISMAGRRTAEERRAIAGFVSGKAFSQPLDMRPSSKAMCTTRPEDFANPLSSPLWNGWGANILNNRFQDSSATGLTAADVPRLKLKWAFAFPGELSSYGQAIVAGGRVFVGSQAGTVYSLNASTGCVHWYYQAAAGVRAAVSIGLVTANGRQRYVAYFGDQAANVYALDAATGGFLWRTKVDNYPVARVTGSPLFHNGRLYVGVASGEEVAGASPDYECCRFRGSLVALNGTTGEQIWRTYTITEEAQRTKKSPIGTQWWGPSGAPIWTAPTIDTRRNAIYVTTGDNYSDPPTANSDAFMAFDLNTGEVLWVRQTTAGDAYNSGCRMVDKTNCPDSNGPDVDYASSPILVTLSNGRRALVAGQKSGVVHAVDPDRNGALLWSTRIGKGGTAGGVQWGSAADQSNIYVALSDLGRIVLSYSTATDADPNAGGGMFALRLDNGERVWYAPPASCGDRKRCSPAQSAAVTAIPGVAFSGSIDGHLRAYSATDGKVVWDFDTVRTYDTVNGVPGRGGSLDGPGPAIAGGMLFTNSGYVNNGGMPGNVLLAFSVDGK